MGDARLSARALGLLVAGIVGIYACMLDPTSVPGGMDFFNLMWPHADLVRGSFAEGRVPLWNWWSWGGAPLLAAWLPAAMYPPMWLAVCLPLPWGLQLLIVTHLVWAGMGAAFLARATWRVSPVGAVVAGIAFAGSGFFVGRVEQVINVAGMAWTPWIVWSVLAVVRDGRRWPMAAAVAAMALLAGHPQFAVLAYLFGGVWAVLWCGVERGWGRPLGRGLVACGAAVAVGLMLAAVQVVPSLELIAVSQRSLGVDDAFTPQLEWQHLWSLVVPRYLNALTQTSGKPIPFSEMSLYFGMTALLLALVGLSVCFSGRGRRRLAVLTVAACGVALAFALGKNTPLAGWMQDVVPGLSSVRGSARATGVFVLLLSGLAGLGASWLLARWSSRRIAAVGAIALPLVLVAELALVHGPELRSGMVTTTLAELATKQGSAAALPVPRLYRFQRDDANFYLDGASASVMQRVERGQPAVNVLRRVGYVDGYEEGLLPTLHYANFLRRYNRNLRSDRLDGALIWLLGSSRIASEYPLRPEGLQPLSVGRRGGLAMYRTEYEPALVGVASISESEWDLWVRAYGAVEGESRAEPMGTTVRQHPLLGKTAADTRALVDSRGVEILRTEPNAIFARVPTEGAPQFVVQTSAFPGWKVRGIGDERSPWKSLDTAATVLMRGEIPASRGGNGARTLDLDIRLQPFSFRLGAFLTMMTLGIVGAFVAMRRRWSRFV